MHTEDEILYSLESSHIHPIWHPGLHVYTHVSFIGISYSDYIKNPAPLIKNLCTQTLPLRTLCAYTARVWRYAHLPHSEEELWEDEAKGEFTPPLFGMWRLGCQERQCDEGNSNQVK